MKKYLFFLFLTLNTVFAQKQAHYETAYLSDSANVRLVMTNIGESLFSPAAEKMNQGDYASIEMLAYGYMIAQTKEGKKYLLDKEGKTLFSFTYSQIMPLRENVFCVSSFLDSVGVVNEKNEKIVEIAKQKIYYLYNGNYLPDLSVNNLLSYSYTHYPTDSFIVAKGDKLFLYNFQNKVLSEVYYPYLQYNSHPIQEKYAASGYFIVQGNKIFLNQREKITQVFPPKKRDYYFSDMKSTLSGDSVYTSLKDVNDQVVLQGEWQPGSSVNYIKGCIIVEKTLGSFLDTLDKEEPIANPLFQTSCAKPENRVGMILKCEYSVVRLSDKKVVYQTIETKDRYYYSPFHFWGEDRIIVEENGKCGIMDLDGKWIFQPSFDVVRSAGTQYIEIKDGVRSFLMSRELKRKYMSFDTHVTRLSDDKTADCVFALVNSLSEDNEWFNIEIVGLKKGNFRTITKLRAKKEYAGQPVNELVDWEDDKPQLIFPKYNRNEDEIGSIFVFKNGKHRFYRNVSEEVDSPPYHFIMENEENGLMWLVDKNGKKQSKRYESISFERTHYECEKGDWFYCLDIQGKVMFKEKLRYAIFNENKALTALAAKNEYQSEAYIEQSNVYYKAGKPHFARTSLFPLSKENLYGYIDSSGKEIVSAVYKKVLKVNDSIRVGINVSLCEKWNIYTGKKTLLPFSDMNIQNINNLRLISAMKGNLWAFLDESLTLKTDFLYKSMSLSSKNSFLASDKSNHLGLIALNNEKIYIPFKYRNIRTFSINETDDVYIANNLDGKTVDIYDNDFQLASSHTYTNVTSAFMNVLMVNKKEKYQLVSIQNHQLVPFVSLEDVNLKTNMNHLRFDAKMQKCSDKQFQYALYLGNSPKLIWKGDKYASISFFQDMFVISEFRQPGEYWVSILDTNATKLAEYKGAFILNNNNPPLIIKNNSETHTFQLLNAQLKSVLPWECDSIMLALNYYIVYRGGKAGIVDSVGNVLLSPDKSEFEHIGMQENDVALAQIANTTLYAHCNGTLYFPKGYTFYKMESKERCIVAKDGKAGCIDNQGNVLIPLKWENLEMLRETHLYGARENCMFFLLNEKGEKLVENAFESLDVADDWFKAFSIHKYHYYTLDILRSFKNDKRIIAKENEEYTIFDSTGKKLLPHTYSSLFPMSDTTYWVMSHKKEGLLSISGKEIVPLQCDTSMIVISGNRKILFLFEQNGMMGFVNWSAQKIFQANVYQKLALSYQMDKNENYYLSATLPNGKMGLIDVEGNEIVPPIYDEIRNMRFTQRLDTGFSPDKDVLFIRKGAEKWYVRPRGNGFRWDKIEVEIDK